MVSFVLLNWNSGGFLDRCIDSLRQQTSNEFELLIVDNGSTNGSLAAIRRLASDPMVREVIELGENRGFAAGMNAGIRRAAGDLIVPLNSDVVLARNFVETLRGLERLPDIGMWAVPTFMWRWDPDQDELTDTLYTVGVTLVRRLSVSGWHPALESAQFLFGPEGTAPILTREAVAAVRLRDGGIYDESYGSYGEDIDLYLRICERGLRCGYTLDTAIWHIGSASENGIMERVRKPHGTQRMMQLNRLRTYARLRTPFKSLRILPWLVMEDVYHVVAARSKLATLRMCIDGYRQLHELSRRPLYDAARFGGTAFSATGKRRSRGPLPTLALDIDALKPR